MNFPIAETDILSIVQNHLYDIIIRNQSLISHHEIYNQEDLIPVEDSYSLLILRYRDKNDTKHTYTCRRISSWISMCPFLRDTLSEFKDTVSINIPIAVSPESISLLGDYIERVHTGESYPPVQLFHLKVRKYMRDRDYLWFSSLLNLNRHNFPHSIRWESVSTLLNTIEIANYLGCESFTVYSFLLLYCISVSLSIPDREHLLGHRYFMLPIEGWNHPLRQMYQIPFLPEEHTQHCTDEGYTRIAKQCDI